jgi:hypothetical protein
LRAASDGQSKNVFIIPFVWRVKRALSKFYNSPAREIGVLSAWNQQLEGFMGCPREAGSEALVLFNPGAI